MKYGVCILAAVLVCLPLSLSQAADENDEARIIYESGLEIIRTAQQQIQLGNPAGAFCLYEEAIAILNKVRETYPAWNPKEVAARIDSITKEKDTLKSQTCSVLAKMDEGTFRFQVLERQQRALLRLDRIDGQLEEAARKQVEISEDVIDIRDDLERRN